MNENTEIDAKNMAEETLLLIELIGSYGREQLREELKLDRRGLIEIRMTLNGMSEGIDSMDEEELFWLHEIAMDIFRDILDDGDDDEDWDTEWDDELDEDEEDEDEDE